MPQPEYRSIKKEDWRELNTSLRRINERISKLEGFSGVSNKHSITRMDGNRILSGPNNQRFASGNEFITKDYLKHGEAGSIISRNVGSGGSAPLILSPDQPGVETLTPAAPSFVPQPITISGETGALMTDFRPNSSLWFPVYTTGNLTSLTFNDISGAATFGLTTDARGAYQRSAMSTLVPRFKVYPDSSHLITIRCKIENLSFAIDIGNRGAVSIGMYFPGYPSGVSTTYGTMMCMTALWSVSTTQAFISRGTFGTQDGRTYNMRYSSPLVLHGTGPFSTVELRMIIKTSTTTTPDSDMIYDIEYNINNTGWVSEGFAGDVSTYKGIFTHRLTQYGVTCIPCIYANFGGVMSGTFTEVEVENGMMGYRY